MIHVTLDKIKSVFKKHKLVYIFLLLLGSSTLLFAFTQGGAGVNFIGKSSPMGHEWLTRLSALELIGGDPVMKSDPKDPRKKWTRGKAKNLSLTGATSEVKRIKKLPITDYDYQSGFKYIHSAIMGERWVDIGGFNLARSNVRTLNCWDSVVQLPASLQQDHFLRQHDDVGPEGGVRAAKRAQQRFIKHFVAAAIASPQTIKVWDGGTISDNRVVDLNYFLFGRAVHLFQDAFSPEHTVRIAADKYKKIRQVKSYLCTKGSEQHSHSKSAILNYKSGDVIWKRTLKTRFRTDWGAYKPSDMTTVALVATEASKDLWAAFIRTMATPIGDRERKAREEAAVLVKNWLSFDEQEMRGWYKNPANRKGNYVLGNGESGSGVSEGHCLRHLGVKSGRQSDRIKKLNRNRRLCIYNIKARFGYSDLSDQYLKIPYSWKWSDTSNRRAPPANWTLPKLIANSGKQIVIKSVVNGRYMTAPKGLNHDSRVFNRKGAPLKLTVVGVKNNGVVFRVRANPNLFLNFSEITGSLKLTKKLPVLPLNATFVLKKIGAAWTIYHRKWRQYIWFNKKNATPYVTRRGKIDNDNRKWVIDGM